VLIENVQNKYFISRRVDKIANVPTIEREKGKEERGAGER
jgi:hypothetical protein